jgi:hypothetical protein
MNQSSANDLPPKHKNPSLISIWIVLALIVGIFIICIPLKFDYSFRHSGWTPEPWTPKRQAQHERILERVQSIGGWNVLRTNCVSFANNIRGGMYNGDSWTYGGGINGISNQLPATIIALKPWAVQVLNRNDNHATPPIVRIWLCGDEYPNRHDGSGPFMGLEVRCNPSVVYNSPYQLLNYRKVADNIDDIYEFY